MPVLGIPTGWNDLAHAGLIKGAVGGGFQAFGALTGDKNATQVGHDITNPAVNIFGAANPAPVGSILLNKPQYSSPAPQGSTQPGSYDVSGGGSTSGGGGGGGGNGVGSPDYGVFQGLYDTEIGNLQNQLGALPAYQEAAKGNIDLQYNPQSNTLQTQHASGLANLDLAQNQLNTQRSQGLRNLGNTLRTALNGYQNQIGVMGAGNSSAAPLIGYALSQQGNREMGDMNTNFNQQQTGLNQQRSDLEANYKNQMDALNGWKQSQLNQIAQQYAQQQAQLQQAIMNSQGDEARYLAMYGQTALANQAISNMKALESQYADQVGSLNNHFQQVNAPVADLSKYSGPYTINQITPGQLTPLSFGANQDNSAAPQAAASLLRKPDQNQGNTPGF